MALEFGLEINTGNMETNICILMGLVSTCQILAPIAYIPLTETASFCYIPFCGLISFYQATQELCTFHSHMAALSCKNYTHHYEFTQELIS